jgi:hypothetical protein
MTTRRRALSEVVSDVLESPALGILLALEADGVAVSAAGDRLKVKPISKLTPEQRAQLEQYRSEILILLRVCGEAVQARRQVFVAQLAAAGECVPPLVFKPGTAYVPGACYSCREPLPHPRHGRCWRCALAARLACQAPIPGDVMTAYDDARVA